MNINNLMKQAQAMQQKMQEEQSKIAQQEFTGNSGGDMVTITIKGDHSISSIKIDPSLLNADEVDMLEDLIIAAHSDAKKKLEDESQNSMSNLMPQGMKLPF